MINGCGCASSIVTSMLHWLMAKQALAPRLHGSATHTLEQSCSAVSHCFCDSSVSADRMRARPA